MKNEMKAFFLPSRCRHVFYYIRAYLSAEMSAQGWRSNGRLTSRGFCINRIWHRHLILFWPLKVSLKRAIICAVSWSSSHCERESSRDTLELQNSLCIHRNICNSHFVVKKKVSHGLWMAHGVSNWCRLFRWIKWQKFKIES